VSELDRERHVLNLLRAQYEALGYAVYQSPSSELLPTFMKGYRPDAIALGEGKNVAIEVKLQRRRDVEDRLRSISERFEGQAEWEFKIVYANEEALSEDVSGVSAIEEIAVQLSEAEALANAKHERAGFILAWAALEAVSMSSREVNSDGLKMRAPRQVLEMLERLGRITFEEAMALRRLVGIRNAVVHGDYTREVKKSDVDEVVKAARSAMMAA
jgi:uncharacterized protein YutE (UPF0331/DUF86 family)